MLAPDFERFFGKKKEFVREEKKISGSSPSRSKISVDRPTIFHRRRERLAFRTFYSIGNVTLARNDVSRDAATVKSCLKVQLLGATRHSSSTASSLDARSEFLVIVPFFPPRIHGMRKLFDGHVTLWAIPLSPLPPLSRPTPHVQLHVGIYFALTNLSIEGRNVILVISLLVKTRGKLANAATVRGFTLVLA